MVKQILFAKKTFAAGSDESVLANKVIEGKRSNVLRQKYTQKVTGGVNYGNYT